MGRRATRDKRRMHRGVLAIVTLVGLAGSLLAAAPEAVAATAPAGRAGSLDTTFGSGGIATFSIAGMTLSSLGSVLVQPDGKLVVGAIQTNVAGSLVVARLNPNGSLDTSFGGGKGYVKPAWAARRPTMITTVGGGCPACGAGTSRSNPTARSSSPVLTRAAPRRRWRA